MQDEAITAQFERLASPLLEIDAGMPSTGVAALTPVDARRMVRCLLSQGTGATAQEAAGDEQQHDRHERGNDGINLFADLTATAACQGQQSAAHEPEDSCLPLAVWITRQGSESSTLEPIVKALTHRADELGEPLSLVWLYEMTGEAQRAVTPVRQKDLEKHNTGRPWRVLLLNRAIIATRSHRPELTGKAYDNLVLQLPEETPRFFCEGLEQAVALDYPQPGRKLVENYYNLWSVERTLH